MSAFRKVLPSFFAFCRTCRKVTLHHGATDEHGCEVGALCTCGAIRDARPCELEDATNVRYVPAKTQKRKAS